MVIRSKYRYSVYLLFIQSSLVKARTRGTHILNMNFIEHKLKNKVGKKIFNRFRNSLYNYVQGSRREPILVTKLCVSNLIINPESQNIHPQHSAFSQNSRLLSISISWVWQHTGEQEYKTWWPPILTKQSQAKQQVGV